MNPDLFANLGIGVASLWIIYIMLKYFMDSLTKKDIQLTTLVDNNNKTTDKFKKHIELCNTNFIVLTKQGIENSKQQTEVLNKLITKINELVVKPVTIKQSTGGDVIVQNKP